MGQWGNGIGQFDKWGNEEGGSEAVGRTKPIASLPHSIVPLPHCPIA